MDEDEDTRLIADNPGYPVAVVPTQSSRTADFPWVNNKITIGSKPVQTENNRNSTKNSADKVDNENVCKHCNFKFANNNLLIKHLFELVAATKKSVNKKIEIAKVPEACQSSKKSKIIHNVIKRKKHSSFSEENVASQSQVEPNANNNENLLKQMSSGASPASDNIYSKVKKVRFSLDKDNNAESVKILSYIYKCKSCNIYFKNKRQKNQHKACAHPDLEDIFVKLPTKNILKERTNPKHKVVNIEKANFAEKCQLSNKSIINEVVINKKEFSCASKDNRNCRNNPQLESTTSKEHLIQQITCINASVAPSYISKNFSEPVQNSLKNNKNTKRQTYIYKCKQCSTYFEDRSQMKQHKLSVHPDHEDMFVKLPTTNILKKKKNTKHKVVNGKKAKKNISAPKKATKIHRNKQISFAKTLLCGPEVKQSLTVQNKASPRSLQDTVTQTQVLANSIIRNNAVSNSVPKKKPIKKIHKVILNKHNKTHSPVRVINSEKIELFKSDCGLHFISCKSLQNHSDICGGSCNTPKIKCQKCGYIFPLDTLVIHHTKHHINNQCNTIFDIVKLSQKHDVLQCMSCAQKFTYKKSYQTHVLKCIHKIKTQNFNNLKVLYKCSQCNLHYATRAGLKEHLKINHLIRNAIKKCNDCNILLSNRSFDHHIKIHHEVLECKLKDLTIKSNVNKGDKIQNKIINSIILLKNPDHVSPSFNNNNFNKNTINESFTDVTEPNIHSKEKAKDRNVSISSVNKELTCMPKAILPNILYKCYKCELHFVTSSAHKDHLSSKYCRDINESDSGKCSKCHLMFHTESVIEHLAHQHFGKLKTANDFLIICNDTVEIQSNGKEIDNRSSDSSTDNPKKLANNNTAMKRSSIKENKNTQVTKEPNQNNTLINSNATDDTRKKFTETEKCIGFNTDSPDTINLASSLESKDFQSIDDNTKEVKLADKCIDTNIKSPDASQETKSIMLSDFKSSRAKIAWAIESIEDSDINKSLQKLNEEVKEDWRNHATVNKKVEMELSKGGTGSTKLNETFNEIEKDVSEEIDSILCALDGNRKELTKGDSCSLDQMTDAREEIQTNKVFEDIDSLVASFDKKSSTSKQQKQNIVLYKCNICCIHFMTPKSLQIHSTNGVHNQDLGTNCNICHLTFNKHTVTKHITKHHEKMNITPLNYIIKTNYRADSTIKRQQAISDFLSKNQHNKNILKYAKNMSGLTWKQKLSLCNVLKKSTKIKTGVTETPGSLKKPRNTLLMQLLKERNKNKRQQDVDNQTELNEDINYSDNSNLVHTSNLEIIDLSNVQNSKVSGDTVIDPAPPQLICRKISQIPNKRKFSVDSNVTNFKNNIIISKKRTKSEDQREPKSCTGVFTNQSYDSNNIMRIDLNTRSSDRAEKSVTLVTENGNYSYDNPESMASRLRLNGIDIMPINSKVSSDVDSKRSNIVQSTKRKGNYLKNKSVTNSNCLKILDKSSRGLPPVSVPSALTISNFVSLETIDMRDKRTKRQNQNQFEHTTQDPTKQVLNNTFGGCIMLPKVATLSEDIEITLNDTKVRDVFSKQECPNSKCVSLNNPLTTNSSCNPETFITFEDSNFEITASYVKDNNANTTAAKTFNIKDPVEQEKLKRKSQSDKRDSKFLSTPTKASTNDYRKDYVEIIDITEETSDNSTRFRRKDTAKQIRAQPHKLSNTVDKNRGALNDRQNRQIAASTNGAGVTDTATIFPTTPNFNLFNIMNDPLYHYLTLQQQYGFNLDQNPTRTTQKQNAKRPKKPNDPKSSNIFDNMQSCPICKCSNGTSSIKNHLRVKRGVFSCCFCARKSTEIELNNHIQICGSLINFRSNT